MDVGAFLDDKEKYRPAHLEANGESCQFIFFSKHLDLLDDQKAIFN